MQPWLSHIRLLSFDAYGTLVQLNPVRQPISDAIAAGAPAGTDPETVFREVLQGIFAALEELALEPDRFITARQIFTDVFAVVLARRSDHARGRGGRVNGPGPPPGPLLPRGGGESAEAAPTEA